MCKTPHLKHIPEQIRIYKKNLKTIDQQEEVKRRALKYHKFFFSSLLSGKKSLITNLNTIKKKHPNYFSRKQGKERKNSKQNHNNDDICSIEQKTKSNKLFDVSRCL